MRVEFNNGKSVKNIPKKFKPVVQNFTFSSDSYKLNSNDRFKLIQRLIKHEFEYRVGSMDLQLRFAAENVMKADEISIIKCYKRNHTEWRIRANSVEIRVDQDLVGDCPKEYLEVKHEF